MSGDRRIPTIIERGDPSKPGVDLYTAMLGARIVFVADTLDATAAMDVAAQLLYLDADGSDRDIALYLRGNNAADATTEAMTIVYDAIRSVGCDVETVCLGQATSTVAVLLAAGTPGKRMIAPSRSGRPREPTCTAAHRAGRRPGGPSGRNPHVERDLMIRLLADHTGQPAEPPRRRPAPPDRADRVRGDRLRARRPSRRHPRPPIRDGGPLRWPTTRSRCRP